MQWTKPDFEEITLCMEVTAYVNTDDRRQPQEEARRTDSPPSAAAPQETFA
jgi:coenzyme PQQ precursor peptide PqqA